MDLLNPARSHDHRSGRIVRGTIAIGLAATLFGAASAVASATTTTHRSGLQANSRNRPVTAGTVATAPVDNAFTITTRSGTETVDVTTSTTYLERGVTTPTLADVTVGKLVAVFGTSTGSTATATEVGIWTPPPAPPVPAAAGKVATAPVDKTFTITTRSGTTETVDVTGTTTYLEHGVTAPTLANVTTGELVVIFGSTSGSTITATEIGIRQGHVGFVIAGTVASAPLNNGFTVTTKRGTTETVTVNASTTYIERGVSAPTLADVIVGGEVGIAGTAGSGNTVTASQIFIAAPRPVSGTLATVGTVATAPVGATFTLTSWNAATTTVVVTSSTTYVEHGTTTPTLADVTVGTNVAVFGTTSGTTVTATEVVIAGGKGHGLFGLRRLLGHGHRHGGGRIRGLGHGL